MEKRHSNDETVLHFYDRKKNSNAFLSKITIFSIVYERKVSNSVKCDKTHAGILWSSRSTITFNSENLAPSQRMTFSFGGSLLPGNERTVFHCWLFEIANCTHNIRAANVCKSNNFTTLSEREISTFAKFFPEVSLCIKIDDEWRVKNITN